MRLVIALSLALVYAPVLAWTQSTTSALPAPGFHHVHLNSTDPDAAIGLYIKAHPSNTKTSLGGLPGFKTSNNVHFLFTRVTRPPNAALPDKVSRSNPQTAFWHFVFPVKNLRETLARYHAGIPDFSKKLFPLYTGPDGKTVEMSGDALPGFLTNQQLEDAKAKGTKPTGDGGYISWAGADGAVMETSQGEERLSIFGMFQEQPYCAVLWYQKHLNAPPPAPGRGGAAAALPRTEANCEVEKGFVVSWPSTYKRGHSRVPNAMGVNFSDVFVRWYMNQEEAPLAPMRGSVVDHFALSVTDLDAWIAKLRAENVTFLQGPQTYRLGDMRAVMIEGPSHEAIELVEVK